MVVAQPKEKPMTTFKRILTVAVFAAFGLGMAACSSGNSSASATTTTPTAQFLSDVSTGNADIAAQGTAWQLHMGNGACTDLTETNGSYDTLAENAQQVVDTSNGAITLGDMGFIDSYALSNLCPSYYSGWETYLQSDGSA
jgi:hypothetical protein